MSIDRLTATDEVQATDDVPLNRSGADRRATVEQLAAAIAELLPDAVTDGLVLRIELAPYSANMGGTGDATEEIQSALNVPFLQPFPTAANYGKGKVIRIPEGLTKVNQLLMSTWSSIQAWAQGAASVLQQRHDRTSGEAGLIQVRDDFAQTNSIGSSPTLSGLYLHGDKAGYPGGSTALEHGVFLPELGGDKDDAPLFMNMQISNFKSCGIKIDKHHNQIRFMNLKTIAHGDTSFWVRKNSDTKGVMLSCGRSLTKQLHLEDCASPQICVFDIWNPGGFTGEYAIQIISSVLYRFYMGEINGKVGIQGDDWDPTGRTSFHDQGGIFNGVQLKIDSASFTGPQAAKYDCLVEIKSVSGVTFANSGTGWNGDPDEHFAAPKWIWKIGPYSGVDVSTSGFVRVNNFNFIHKYRDDSGNPWPQVAFTKHWTNRRDRVIWEGKQIGELVCVPTSEIGINLIAANGATVDTVKWPLLWLTLNAGNNLDDGGRPATFVVPAYAPAGTPAHMTWCYVGWL